jgi:hypothetical protein
MRPTEKTTEQVAAEIEAVMRQRHGRTYKYRKFNIYGNDASPIWANIVIKVVVEYRHGEIEIDNILTKEEMRDIKLGELGI